ncbi:hypothetical protein [Pedobacter sp.]
MVVAAASAGARSKDAEVTPLIVVVNEEPDKVLFTVVATALPFICFNTPVLPSTTTSLSTDEPC